MKKLISTITAIFVATFIFAQSPELINYQGVARNLSGNPISNQNISLRISILSGSPSGSTVYSEIHNLTTNNLGLFSIQIGNGSVQTGTFSNISWGSNSYYLQIEIDENGGTTYNNVGTTQMVSVPYALYAKEAGNGSKWTDNSKGIYRDNGLVLIGDTIDHTWLSNGFFIKNFGIVNAENSEFAFGVDITNGAQFFGFSNATETETFSLKKDYRINNEPTFNLSSDANQGSARHFNFRSDGKNHFTVLGTGNVGIGTNTTLPSSKLHIKGGDVYVDNIASGVVMKSPNGNCWRVTVDNSGNLVRTAITCP